MCEVKIQSSYLRTPDLHISIYSFNNKKLVGLTHILAGKREARAHSERERERAPGLTPRLQQTREKQNKTHHTRFIKKEVSVL